MDGRSEAGSHAEAQTFGHMLVQNIEGDDQIQIAYLPGTNDKAVVAFNGVEFGLGGIALADYRFTQPGSINHVYLVTDRTRHWYNSSAPQLVKLLNSDFDFRMIKNVTTLGNSMGGFGAIFFANLLTRCNKAIAFSAQSAVDPSVVPWENRFDGFTASIRHWNGLDATRSLRPDIDYFLFFGAEDLLDVRHAERLASARASNMTVCLIEATGHEVAFDLLEHDVLPPLIAAMINSDRTCISLQIYLQKIKYRILQKPTECI